MENRLWSKTEKALLRKHYLTMTVRALAAELGRSCASVKYKLGQLRLKKYRLKPEPEIKAATKAAVDPRPARQRPHITVVKHPAGRIITHRMAG